MSRKVIKSDQAKADLKDHARHIAQHSPKAARRFITAMKDALDRLARWPEMGSVCEFENPAAADLRFWVIPAIPLHVIVYRPHKNGIEVIRVLLAARNWQKLFDPPKS